VGKRGACGLAKREGWVEGRGRRGEGGGSDDEISILGFGSASSLTVARFLEGVTIGGRELSTVGGCCEGVILV